MNYIRLNKTLTHSLAGQTRRLLLSDSFVVVQLLAALQELHLQSPFFKEKNAVLTFESLKNENKYF